MMTLSDMKTVLISTSTQPTGAERIVVAFRDGDDLLVPLDGSRPANQKLLAADRLFVRKWDHADHRTFDVRGHRAITDDDRALLERRAAAPISVLTEVLHLTPSPEGPAADDEASPGFMVVLDGSERAAYSLAPAVAIADWYGRPCTIIEVTAGDDDLDTPSAVRMQLDDAGFDQLPLMRLPKPDLDDTLFEFMAQGDVVVTSAFGAWDLDGRLHGMLNGLVHHDAPAVIGVGPNVPNDWHPESGGPIVVCVDDSEHAHHLVDQLDAFLYPCRGRVVVLHVSSPNEPGTSAVAADIASEINKRFGIPTEAKTIIEESAAAGIAIFASRTRCQLVITHSWHRPQAGRPTVSSTSLSSVAHVPCPVVILAAEPPSVSA